MLDRFRHRAAPPPQPTGRWWLDLAGTEFAWCRDLGLVPGPAEETPEGAALELSGPGAGLMLWWEHEGTGALGGILWRGADRMDALNLVPLLWHYRPDLPPLIAATHDRDVAAAATRAWSEALRPVVRQVLTEEVAGRADWEPVRSSWHEYLRSRGTTGR